MGHHLSIDIETYSGVDIKKGGLYKYVEAPDFQVLLLAYSLDSEPVRVLDLAQGEKMPAAVWGALSDPGCTKHAYNAAFEWYCLSKSFRVPDPVAWLPQWRCTMLHGLYCGYTVGLDATGKALGLPSDKQKLTTGKALIRYFCTPCKPSGVNGMRSHNLPDHDPGRWELFKTYNAQDVVTEMEIERRLSRFPVPEKLQCQWELDQVINTRGVAVDRELLEGALWCGETTRQGLLQEAAALSGLENPNSLQKLARWLEQETGEALTDLRKETVSALLEGELESPKARRMLELRRELGKTSTKKYDAMAQAVCEDGRVRGLLQFYGANRTGRWAGRLVQVQNLPRTYLTPLPLARQLVKDRRLDILRVLYGSVPDTLSQIIRTALVPAPGNVLVDADFSAIEARVIAWLAGEQWRLEVFRTHGKIYEASASQMFGVPLERIVKGNPEYSLRQKGKVAELALGYQGGAGALIQMGALGMGLAEEELPEIVSRWRRANRRICDLWYAVEKAAVSVMRTGVPAATYGLLFSRELDPDNDLDFLTILLPGGRKLYYAKPCLSANQWGQDALHYQGMNQTSKKWQTVDTYGGKLVENCIQAIARDCLAEAVTRLEAAGYQVVFHVHDEVVFDCPRDKADLAAVCGIMAEPVGWAPGLPLGADGWVDGFYKKD